MTKPLSPSAQAVWDAFNQDEAGVFVDYGDKLAAAFAALADQVVPVRLESHGVRTKILAIAAELGGVTDE